VLAEQSGDTARTTTAYSEFLAAWKIADAQLPQVQHAQQWITAHPNQAMASSSHPAESTKGLEGK
jgi:hypothetical protein